MKACVIGLAVVLYTCAVLPAQDSLSTVRLTSYRVIYSQPTVNFSVEIVARATVNNSGAAIPELSAILESSSGIVIEAGRLNFGPVAAGATSESINTFVYRTSSLAPLNPASFKIRFTSNANAIPIAFAGLNKTTKETTPIVLSGNESNSPSGKPLHYIWYLASQPPGSGAALGEAFGVNTSFVPERPGRYVAQLIVHDGDAASAVASVIIGASAKVPPSSSAESRPPSEPGKPFQLSGASSSDANGLPLTYAWKLLSTPPDSRAALDRTDIVNPRLLPDQPGEYVAELVVHNGHESSCPALVTVRNPVAEPKADAGRAVKLEPGRLVHLNGSGSTDPQSLPLTYHWDLITVPSGSTASLSDPSSATPSFIADLPGTYVAQLVVHNGTLASRPSTVMTSTSSVPPIANPGPNQLIGAGTAVQLDGSASTDENGLMLNFQWSLVSVPQGSLAALDNVAAVRPVFTADLPGTYIAQLSVSDSLQSSTPAQVVVSTVAIPPTASAGPAQLVTTGTAVTLNGASSMDPNGLPLSYSWTLLSIPQGSAATLIGANTASPSFTVDMTGNYVAQLIVTDSNYSSAPATVLITTTDLPPIANAGSSDTVPLPGGLVTLNGTGSTDPLGLPLTYSWSFVTIPANSTAVLSNPIAVSPKFIADLPGIYVAQLIVNDGVQNSQPVTVVINGQFPSAISVSLNNSSLITYASTLGDVNISNPAISSGGTGCNGQVVQISLDSANLGVLSTSSANPATSVCIPVGLQDAAFTLTSNGTTGGTTVTGFAPNFQTGTASFSVTARQISMSFDTTTIGQGRVANGTLTLSSQAPAAGVTINLASSLPAIASVSPSSVTIAPGQTNATFQVNGLAPGQPLISATAQQAGYLAPSQTITVLSSALTITIPHNLVVGPGQIQPFPISIGAAASSAVTVNLAVTGGPGNVTFSVPSVTIPAGSTSPSPQPTITGATLGNVTVSGSATGYAPDIESESVSVTLTLSPSTVNVLTSNPATMTLSASSRAPAGGLVVSLALADPTLAHVPATVTIPAGASSVKFYVTGKATGTTTLTAGGTGYVAATASIQVSQAPPISFSGCPGTLGLNAISEPYNQNYPCTPYLGAPAPAGGETVTVTSSNPTLVTLTPDPTTTGAKSVTLTYAGGSTSPSTPASGGFYLAALASSGTVTVTATAPGYNTSTFTVTLTPSGFNISGGTQTTTLAGPSNVNVYFVSLDPASLAPTGYQLMRPGAASVIVALANDNTKVGKLGAANVTIAAGTFSATTTYTPIRAGTSNISIPTAPTGYAMASSGTTTQFTVVPPAISFSGCPSTLGINAISEPYSQNYPCTPYLGAPAPTGGETLTVTSSNASLVTLTLDPTTIGTKSVTLTYAGGSTSPSTPASGGFYLAALASSGTVTITASATGYKTSSFTVTLTPSGFTISGGAQITNNSGPSNVNVYFNSLDPVTLNPTGYQLLRPGAASANVVLANDNSKAGKLGAGYVTLAPGNFSATTTYTPVRAGTSNISISTIPKSYTMAASGTSTQFTVVPPGISFVNSNCPSTLAMNAISEPYYQNLACVPYLGAPAPAGGTAMTVTSSNASLVTLTLDPTTTGAKSITLNYSGGSTSPSSNGFYLAALASSGTVTITATATGYKTSNFTVTLTPSGFTISGGTQTTTFASPSSVSVYFVSLDPTSLNSTGYQLLRPGAPTVNVSLANDNPGAGTLGSNTVAIAPGTYYASTTYTPAQVGTSNISIASTPVGYAAPSSGTSTQFTVVTPSITWYGSCPSSLGLNTTSQIYYQPNLPCVPNLGALAPAGGESMIVTSSNASLVTLTLNPATVGRRGIALNYPAGSTTPSNGGFYLAALASAGTVTITASAPGFNTATFTVTLTPSGFTITGGTQTTTFSGPTGVTVYFNSLDPVSLNPTGFQLLRPGAPSVNVNLANDNTVAGTLSSNTVTIAPGSYYASTNYTPAQTGTSNISIAATPTGYTTPFSGVSTQFTVVAPNISFYGNCPSTLGLNTTSQLYYQPNQPCVPNLMAPAPAGGEAMTVSSSNASLVTLTVNPANVGQRSITLNYAAGNTSPSNNGFYLAALAGSGTVTITASAPGFNTATFTVTLTPSGFIINGGTQTTTFSGPTGVNVYFVSLDPVSLNSTGYQILRPGAPSVSVSLANDNTSAGTLSSNTVTIAPGNFYASTNYNPVSAGTSNISIATTPTGYTKPFSGTSTQFVVTAPNIGVTPVTVGNNLMTTTYGQLLQGAPSDNYAVTISVADSTQLLLSATGTDLGTSSLTFNLSQGQTQTPQFWIYGMGAPGTYNVNVSTSGGSGTGAITVDPSGFVFQNQNFTTALSAAPTTLYIVPAALDPQYLSLVAVQQLRPGMTNTQVTVNLTDQPSQGSGPSKVGQITVNPVVFNGDDNPNQQITSFQPIGAGQTLLQLTSPGFSSSSSEVTATVTQ